MVKCDAPLLAASIFLGANALTSTLIITPVSDTGTQTEHAAPPNAGGDANSATPIHRVILMFEPVKALSDAIVTTLHDKTLAQKTERNRKHSLPQPRLPGDAGATPTFTIPGKLPIKLSPDPAESVNSEQLTALADLYLTDAVKTRLMSRYKITVLDAAAVNAAIGMLHLSRDQAAGPDGAQELCSRLECDAVVVVGRPVLTLKEGLTRNLVVRTEIRVAALRDPNGGFTPTHKSRDLPIRLSAARTTPRVDFTVAGAAVASRAFMRPGYTSNYPALAQQAASQAAAIALHTLSTGEQAPLVSAGTRIAIAPAYGPDRADVLVLSSADRHTDIGAVKQLPTDVADLFRPDLLPVLSNDVVAAAAAAAAMRLSLVSPPALWRDNYNPDVDAVRKLGNRLKVHYLLLAHLTDVEVATAPSGEGDNSGTQRGTSPPLDTRLWEREAHAEAYGALIHIQDGEVIWTDRGDTTVTSREMVAPSARAAANRNIAMDAEKFALIDLKRHFASFRSQFEQ